MLDASGDALEWAIALAKAPGERSALRQRPVPDGLERLLQIATGSSPDLLAEVATQRNEDPNEILEAARFYAREVLFFKGADAYRVLGVRRDAPPEVVRSHHRLLQLWLHPDRQTSDWDAIFAARVNAAWTQLRSTERRQAYDAANPEQHANASMGSLLTTAWEPVSQSPSRFLDRWRRRMPLLALFAICGWLGVLAVRDMQQGPDPISDVLTASNASVAESDVVQLTVPVNRPLLNASMPAVAPAQGATARLAIPTSATAMPKARLSPAPDEVLASASVLTPSRVEAQRPQRVATAASPLGPVGAPVNRADVAAATKPVTIAMAASSLPASKRAAVAAVNLKVPKPVAAMTARKAAAAAGQDTVMSVPPQKMPAPDAIVRETSQQQSPSAVPAVRVQQAQQVGSRLIAFMSRPTATIPPIWGSLNAQRGATQLRDGLHGDHDIKVAAPQWRVGQNAAAMKADIRYADGSVGRLSADLAWREERWLVTGLSLERDL